MPARNFVENNTLHASFQTIALVGKPRNDVNLQMHKNLFHWLSEKGYQVLIEQQIGEYLALPKETYATLDEIGSQAQLAIVIGGDGNMLGRARILAKYDIALIGINRGNLGFLTDIDPKTLIRNWKPVWIVANFLLKNVFYWKPKLNEMLKLFNQEMLSMRSLSIRQKLPT